MQVSGRRQGQLGVELQVRAHKIVSGTSEKNGGADEGFDPHELVTAGLAACTIITCQMYAARKQWPLEDVKVDVAIESETKEGASFVRTVSFVGALDDEQRTRLMDIANHCPVHNLLSRPITIRTVPGGTT